MIDEYFAEFVLSMARKSTNPSDTVDQQCLKNLHMHILEELEFHFGVLGISETNITNSNVDISTPLISGYNFEFVPTPLASGGVALFIDEKYKYRDRNFSCKEKECICGIIYRQHNSPERFQQYFDESIEKYKALDKEIRILGDFNIDPLKAQSSNYNQDFLMSLQSCYLIPTVVKPTRVRSTSATLIDNIFVNTPEKVLVSGNIISDISDHFSQFTKTSFCKSCPGCPSQLCAREGHSIPCACRWCLLRQFQPIPDNTPLFSIIFTRTLSCSGDTSIKL